MLAVLVLFFFFGASPAFAYLDPATGSLLLYALVGIATTILFAARNLWYGLKGRALLSRGIAVSRGLADVVFHSEGGRYWQVFQPVIAALSDMGVACAYVTPDAADPALSWAAPGFKAINPGREIMTIATMNAISAAVVVSTTPGLDVYMLKRSAGVKHYAHIFHAPTDVAFYEKFAFDYYDSLLTVGPFQERSVRQLEKRRGFPQKRLWETGCTYYEYMLAELRDLPPGGDEGLTVLYAPAWGPRSSVLGRGVSIVETLAGRGIKVIARPHPQSTVSDPEALKALERVASRHPEVRIDRNRTGIRSMHESDVMIADFSGVLFDYAFLFERPIFLASAEVDLGGQEGEDLSGEIWDVETSRSLAHCLSDEDVTGIADVVSAADSDRDRHALRSREVRETEIYNFASAGPAAAANICEILQDIA